MNTNIIFSVWGRGAIIIALFSLPLTTVSGACNFDNPTLADAAQCFDSTANREIPGFDLTIQTGVDVNQCALACLQNASCRSFEFLPTGGEIGECRLSGEDAATQTLVGSTANFYGIKPREIDGADAGADVTGTENNDRIKLARHNRKVDAGKGNDQILAARGRQQLTGGLGIDHFVYTAITEAGDVIVDFEAGTDKINIAELLRRLGFTGSDFIAGGYGVFLPRGNDTILSIDPDGPGSGSARPFLLVRNVALADLNNPDNFIVRSGSRAGKAGVSPGPGKLEPLPEPNPIDAQNQVRLLAIYMVGSDLEGGTGGQGNAGTNDFNELIAGFNALTPDQQDNVAVVVAFGGANKPGWKGMKFVDMQGIIDDGANQKYGDETAEDSYLYTANGANMGDQSSLKLFLDYVKGNYTNFAQTTLIMWDHGASYGDFGNDENFNSDGLSLAEMSSAFNDADPPKFDVLGFDACLNGSLEIANIFQGRAEILIGSEELEPGHGWFYTKVIEFIATSADRNALATSLVNNFIDDPANSADGKTLSAVLMSQFTNVNVAATILFNRLVQDFDSEEEVRTATIHANTNAFGFGKQGRNDASVSVDLNQLLDLLDSKIQNSGIKSRIAAVRTNLQDYIVASREDKTRPKATGVTVAALTTRNYDKVKANDGLANYIKKILDFQEQDQAKPEIMASATNLAANASQTSRPTVISAQFADANLAEVRQLLGFTDVDANGTPFFFSIFDRPALEGSQPGEFSTAPWDGNAVFVRYGPGEDDEALLPLIFKDSYVKDGKKVDQYIAEMDILLPDIEGNPTPFDEDIGDKVQLAVLEIDVDEDRNVVGTQIREYRFVFESEDDEVGRLLFDRDVREVEIGEKIVFYAPTYDMPVAQDEEIFLPTTEEFIEVRQPLSFVVGVAFVEGDATDLVPFAALKAKDFSNNFVLTVPEQIEPVMAAQP